MGNVQHDSATPAHGQQVISAVAFIHKIDNGVLKVFLPRRAETKAFLPGVYELPGGHIDFGEDIVIGLKREVMEEFGMNVSIGDPFACFTYVNKVKGSHSIEVAYFGAFTDDESKIVIDPEDHSDFGWFSRQELIDNQDAMRSTSAKLTDSVEQADEDDREFAVIMKGFDILEGKNLYLG